jgi:hypothetical protein
MVVGLVKGKLLDVILKRKKKKLLDTQNYNLRAESCRKILHFNLLPHGPTSHEHQQPRSKYFLRGRRYGRHQQQIKVETFGGIGPLLGSHMLQDILHCCGDRQKRFWLLTPDVH